MMLDSVLLAFHNLRTRPTRAGLTILGVVVGVAAVAALVAIGQGMQRSVQEQFRAIGYNTVVVTPGGADAGTSALGAAADRFSSLPTPVPRGGGTGFPGAALRRATSVPLDRIRALPEVVRAGVIRTETAFVTSPGMSGLGVLRVTGVSAGIFDDFPGYFPGFAVDQGRGLAAGDGRALLLGSAVAADLGVTVGSTVQIEDQEFTVVGILASTTASGVGITYGNLNLALFVPIEQLSTLFGSPERFTLGLVEARTGEDVERVAEVVRTTFTESGIPVSAVTTRELSARITAVLGGMQATLTAIAAVALLVGAIGVMNTMYTSVLERTRHIGVMKAVGAKDRQVLGLYLVESGLLGLLGGGVGVGVGAALSGVVGASVGRAFEASGELASLAGTFSPRMEAWLVVGALAGSFLLGAMAGALPALRAARLRPVEALRHE
ncbi:MAG: ABC transporter permease [Candidatus Bipolaricaulota bacterium]|nr:ABC transporter permease [Candidatus Bipolaricaulota bacterium]